MQRVQETEAVFRYTCLTIYRHTADGLSHPCWVSTEQFVIVRRTQEFHDPQLHNKMVNQLLSLFFRQNTFLQITFNVDIQEG
ncbi:hypothetical protein D3C73_1436390 [compost metagenome]